MRALIAKTTLAAAFAAVAVAGVVHAASAQDEPAGPVAGAFSTPKVEITAVQSDQSNGFTIFDRQPGPADAIPANVERLLGETEITGKNPSLARAIPSTRGTVWAIPGDDIICLALPDPYDTVGLGCTSTKNAAASGLVSFLADSRTPNEVLVALVLPKGATATATYGSRTEKLAPNDDGAVATVLTDATSVTVTTPIGSRTYAVPSAAKLTAGS